MGHGFDRRRRYAAAKTVKSFGPLMNVNEPKFRFAPHSHKTVGHRVPTPLTRRLSGYIRILCLGFLCLKGPSQCWSCGCCAAGRYMAMQSPNEFASFRMPCWGRRKAPYPTLQRWLMEGWVRAEWGTSETNRRVRFYQLTTEGQKQLKRELVEYKQVTAAIQAILRTA